jgi:hypothetical protein
MSDMFQQLVKAAIWMFFVSACVAIPMCPVRESINILLGVAVLIWTNVLIRMLLQVP